MQDLNVKNHTTDTQYYRQLIEKTGLSQNEVAKRLGVSHRTMRYYLSGTNPPPYTFQYALEALVNSLNNGEKQ
jgi:transcriptional regulator with XRE-family HTH domain